MEGTISTVTLHSYIRSIMSAYYNVDTQVARYDFSYTKIATSSMTLYTSATTVSIGDSSIYYAAKVKYTLITMI